MRRVADAFSSSVPGGGKKGPGTGGPDSPAGNRDRGHQRSRGRPAGSRSAVLPRSGNRPVGLKKPQQKGVIRSRMKIVKRESTASSFVTLPIRKNEKPKTINSVVALYKPVTCIHHPPSVRIRTGTRTAIRQRISKLHAC
jgi:hypothetical protein